MDFLTVLLSLGVLFSSWFGRSNQSLGQEVTTFKSVHHAGFNTPVTGMHQLHSLYNQHHNSEFRKTSMELENMCFCILQNPNSILVPEYVNPDHNPIERLVTYFYIDRNSQKVKMYIPNERKQVQIPDLRFDNNDIVMDVTNHLPLYDIIAKNPFRVNITNNPSNVQIKPINFNDPLEKNIFSPDPWFNNGFENFHNDKKNFNPSPPKGVPIILNEPETDITFPTHNSKHNPLDTISDIENPDEHINRDDPIKIHHGKWDRPHHQKTFPSHYRKYDEDYWSHPNKHLKPWHSNPSEQGHHYIPDYYNNPTERSPTDELSPRPPFWPPIPDKYGFHDSKDFNGLPSYLGNDVPHVGKFDDWLSDQIKCIDSLQVTNAIETREFKTFVKKTLMDHGLYLSKNGVLLNQSGIAVNLNTLKLQPVLIGNSFTYQKLISYIGGYKQIRIPESPYLQFVIVTLSNPNKLLGVIPLGVVYLPNQLPFNQRVNKINGKNYRTSSGNIDLIHGISTPVDGKKFGESYGLPFSSDKIGELLKYFNNIDRGYDTSKGAFEFINEGEVPDFRIIGGGAATGSGTPLSIKGRSGRLPAITNA